MSKKKNRPPSTENLIAQNLIDGLLDDKASTKVVARPAPPSLNTETSTASIINLQERIEERTNSNRKPDAPDLANDPREFSMSQNGPHNFELSSPAVAKVKDPVARAMSEEAGKTVVQPSPKPSASPTHPTVTAPESLDERTVAVAPTSRTVNPKTATEPSPKPALNPAPIPNTRSNPPAEVEFGTLDRMMPTEIKAAGGQTVRETKQKVANPNYAQSGSAFGSSEAALKQSESLRVAQKRITELEQELEEVRRENENLHTAAETLRRRTDELLTKTEQLESRNREAEKIHENENHIRRSQLQSKDRELGEYRSRLDELQSQLDNDFKKIRVRERELGHRLEIIKMESATLIAGKDKMLLDLKRQIDDMKRDNTQAKQDSVKFFNQFQGKQETIRRVVRALRIALTILEGDEDAAPAPSSTKKNDP